MNVKIDGLRPKRVQTVESAELSTKDLHPVEGSHASWVDREYEALATAILRSSRADHDKQD